MSETDYCRYCSNAWIISNKKKSVAKIKDPSRLNHYRSISILPALSKALEKIMNDQIVALCDVIRLLNRFQYGLRSGHSTITALLKVTNDIAKDLNLNFISVLVLLDCSKSYCYYQNSCFFSESAVKFVRSILNGTITTSCQ
jgi:Reverse transcriptase (RNA-dependent DNA polymerase)